MSKSKTGDYMNKLLSGEMTPVEFRDYVMKNVEPKISKKEENRRRRYSEQFDAICAIENIYPTEEQIKNSEMYITGRLTNDENYLFVKYINGVLNA